jgi:Outer membrane protein beta-barrel domain
MSLKNLILMAVMTVCTFAAQAAAQKNELSGMLGRTFISDQGIQGAPSYDPNLRFGKGFTFEVNYARRILDGPFWSVAVEVPFVDNPDEDMHAAENVVPGQYSSIFITPSARLRLFPEQAVSPWVSFGGGFGHFGESSTLEFGGVNPDKNGNTTAVLQAGVGFDVKIVGSFSLRGEARDFWAGVPDSNANTGKSRQHNIFVSGGIVWHF